MSAIRTQALPWLCSSSGRTSRPTAASRKTTMFLLFFMVRSSSPVRHTLAEQPRGPQRQHDDQNDERKDVAVVAAQYIARERADVARADGFDQPQQDAANHRAGEVADAAEHSRSEGLEARDEAHRVLCDAVVG